MELNHIKQLRSNINDLFNKKQAELELFLVNEYTPAFIENFEVEWHTAHSSKTYLGKDAMIEILKCILLEQKEISNAIENNRSNMLKVCDALESEYYRIFSDKAKEN